MGATTTEIMRTRTLTAIAATCAAIAATLALAAPAGAGVNDNGPEPTFTDVSVWEDDATVLFYRMDAATQNESSFRVEARRIGTNAPPEPRITGRALATTTSSMGAAPTHAVAALIAPGAATPVAGYYCNATLISVRHVLTTAECAQQHPRPVVVTRTRDISGVIDEDNMAVGVAIDIAPGYRGDPNENNYAVITLHRSVASDARIALLEAPTDRVLDSIKCGARCSELSAKAYTWNAHASPTTVSVGPLQSASLWRLDARKPLQDTFCSETWGNRYDSIRHSCISTDAGARAFAALCAGDQGAAIWAVDRYSDRQVLGVAASDDLACDPAANTPIAGPDGLEPIVARTIENVAPHVPWIRSIIGVGRWQTVAELTCDTGTTEDPCRSTVEDLDVGSWHFRVRYDGEATIDKGTSAIIEWAPRPPVAAGLGGARNDCDSDDDGIDELVVGSRSATVVIDTDGSARHRGRPHAVACGDLDGDGIDDLVTVTTTRTHTVITTHFADRTVRTRIAGGGGVRGEVTAVIANANRRPGNELIIGQPDAGNGRVTVWTAGTRGLRRLATIAAPSGADGFGRAIAVGNVLGNRHAELVVASDGAVIVHPTRRNAPRARPMRTIDTAGVATLAIGNVDRDRANEIVAGTPTAGPRNAGAIAIIEPRRPRAGRTLDATDATTTARRGERLGRSIVLADTDDDGIDDIMAGGNRGRIFRFDGGDAIIIHTPGRPRGFGRIVAAADIDDDGADELVTTQRRGNRTVVIALDGLDSTPQRSIVTRIAGRVHLLY